MRKNGPLLTEGKRITGLVGVMMVAVTLSTAIAITILYRTAFEQERAHLIQSAHDQASLMGAVARFNRSQDGERSAGAAKRTLAQIESAFDHHPALGQRAEIDVGRRDGNRIVYLVQHGRFGPRVPSAVPFSSRLGEPMRRAVSGRSGSMIGLDDRGVTVIAAYAPVAALNLGVVAKIDLASLRAPFLRAAATVIGLALVLVTAGTLLFRRLTNPLVRHLTETEQRYERIFHGAPVPIWEEDFSKVRERLDDLARSGVTDIPRHLAEERDTVRRLMGLVAIKDVNAAALRQFGARTKGQFDAWFSRELIPAALDIEAEQLGAIAAGREALLTRTVVTRTLDGRELSSVLAVMIPQAQHGYGSVPVSALDMTSTVQLRRREEELARILASTGEGIFGVDADGRCAFVNRAALEMLGYQHEGDLLGQDIHAKIHCVLSGGEQASREECAVCRARCDDAGATFEDERLCRADGRCFPAECRSYPMVSDGLVVGTVVTFTDISERKRREAQLVHAQKMEVVGHLTGAIAHDFNNLLSIVLTNLHLLGDSLGQAKTPDVSEMLEDSMSALTDGAAQVRRLLAFSRRQPLEPQWTELGPFIGHVSRLLSRVTGDGVDLVVRQSAEALPVRIDRQQLENALLNLVINARDAMPGGGTLTIETQRRHIGDDDAPTDRSLSSGTYAVIRVTDTGVGMSSDELARAFDPFYSTKPVGRGTGLGLSTALGFARQSGGGLTVSSVPGRGTTASLWLPRAESGGPDRAAARDAGATEPGAATVLVVDDEARMRKLAKRTLVSLGYRVLEAGDAATAMQVLERHEDIELLFTDVVMPGRMDGHALARWARRRHPKMRVLLTTGFDYAARNTGHAGGSAPTLLPKPYSRQQLAQALLTALNPDPPSADGDDPRASTPSNS